MAAALIVRFKTVFICCCNALSLLLNIPNILFFVKLFLSLVGIGQ